MEKRISGTTNQENVSETQCGEPSYGSRRDWFRHAVSAVRSFRKADPDISNRSDGGADASVGKPRGGGRASNTESWLKQMTHRAMNGEFQLLFEVGRYRGDLEAGMNVFERLDQLESQLSYFRVTSEVSRINAMAFEVPMVVKPRLFALLTQCMELSRLTDGAIDITSAPLTELWKTARQQERIPTQKEILAAKNCCGYMGVELNPELRTIRFLRPGMRINLGCIGKGFALDETATILTEAGICDFLYHGGYSSILASGSKLGTKLQWNSPTLSASTSPLCEESSPTEGGEMSQGMVTESTSLCAAKSTADATATENVVGHGTAGVHAADVATGMEWERPMVNDSSERSDSLPVEETRSSELVKAEWVEADNPHRPQNYPQEVSEASDISPEDTPSRAMESEVGWWVGLRDPLHPERRIARLRLRNRAIGTSGSQIQFFRYHGRRYGHLLDPRTGWPPQTNRAVTVVAPTATLADGLSTAFYVLTPEEIANFCETYAERFPGLAVLLVDAEEDGGCEIYSHGFADGDLETF